LIAIEERKLVPLEANLRIQQEAQGKSAAFANEAKAQEEAKAKAIEATNAKIAYRFWVENQGYQQSRDAMQAYTDSQNVIIDNTEKWAWNQAVAFETSRDAMQAYIDGQTMVIAKTTEMTETQKAMSDAAMSGYETMAGALGSALVTGEEGWKAFGRAGLNAIAGVIDAMAIEADAIVAKAIAQVALGDFTKIPGLGSAIGTSLAIHAGAGAVRAIPMAEGGMGTVTKPTLFLAGEAGPEDFAFGPKSRGGLSGGGVTIIQNIGGSVIALAMSGMAQAARGY